MPAPKRFLPKKNVQLTPEQFAWVQDRAERSARSISGVIRHLIQREMADESVCRECRLHYSTHKDVQA